MACLWSLAMALENRSYGGFTTLLGGFEAIVSVSQKEFCEEGAIKARSTALSSESAPQDAGLVAQE